MSAKTKHPEIYKFIEGAKRLFQEVVTSEPTNAAAWIAYIDNYYLIETNACSPCIPWVLPCDCPESQKKLVREAFRHCRNDSTITIWNNFLFPKYAPLPDALGMEHFSQPQKKVSIVINNGDHSGSVWELSPDEFNLVKKAYTMVRDNFLVLNKTHIDENTQRKLVDILGGCLLYRIKFCRDLEKIRKHGG